MSDRRYRQPLRSQGLPIVLACALAASLGGCASLRMSDLLRFGSSQAACESNAWPTKVMGSVQRAKKQSYIPVHAEEQSYEPEVEESPAPIAESKPEPLVENSSVSEQAAEAGPSATPPAPPQPAVENAPTAEPQQDVIARLQQPVAPPRPPSPEVVEVCGATDTACQDQLMTLLADPLHKWINAKPTSRDERTGVRILAYRVLTPVLACDDLRRGLRETQAAAAGKDSGATQPEATENGKSLEWVQLLRRSVNLELKAEIDKRC